MWPIYMQGDGAIVLQPATEEEMEGKKKLICGDKEANRAAGSWEWYLRATRRMWVGRLCCRGRLSSLCVLERRTKKIGKSVRGEMVRIQIPSVRPVPSCKWHTFTRHRLGLRPIVQVGCYACSCTAQIERGSQATNTSRRLSHCQQPCGTIFHRSRLPTSAYVFLIRFVLFFFVLFF